MAAIYDLRINQGEDFEQTFQWLTGNDKPVNLTGYAGRCHIKADAQQNFIAITATVTIINADEGRFLLSIPSAQTSAMTIDGMSYNDVKIYAYDVEMVLNGGKVYRVLNGYAKISPEVTK